MKDHHTRYVQCPHCGALLDGALNTTGREEPKDWDPTVCIECGQIAVFEFALPGGLRRPGDADWKAWARQPGLIDALSWSVSAIAMLRQQRGEL